MTTTPTPAAGSGSRLELPVQTPRLTLRAYRPDDVEASLAYYSLPETVAYVPWPPWTREDAERLVAVRATRTGLTTPDSILSLVIEHDGVLIGDLVLWPADETMSRGELGWALAPAAHGHGFATEAVAALVAIAFERYGMHRVVARVDPRNVASLRVCERVGLQREGHLRQDSFLKGEWVDSVVFGALASQWVRPAPARTEIG